MVNDYYNLVGGLEPWNFYDFPYIGNNNPNWRTHIFQDGGNHQPVNNGYDDI